MSCVLWYALFGILFILFHLTYQKKIFGCIILHNIELMIWPIVDLKYVNISIIYEYLYIFLDLLPKFPCSSTNFFDLFPIGIDLVAISLGISMFLEQFFYFYFRFCFHQNNLIF